MPEQAFLLEGFRIVDIHKGIVFESVMGAFLDSRVCWNRAANKELLGAWRLV